MFAKSVILCVALAAMFCSAADERFEEDVGNVKDVSRLSPKSLRGRSKVQTYGFLDAIPLWMDTATILRLIGDYRFVGLLKDAHIYSNLTDADPFTVFAANNMAFVLLPFREQKLLYNKTVEALVGLYSVVHGRYRSPQLTTNDMLVPSVLGPNLRFNTYRSGALRTVNGKPLAFGEFLSTNGIVHQMNNLLLDIPVRSISEIVGNSTTLTTFYRALNNSDMLTLLDGPGPLTLFAPTDAAFAKLPPGVVDSLLANTTLLTDLVRYHIVPSTYFCIGLETGKLGTLYIQDLSVVFNPAGPTINGANVTRCDELATNGVIQELDAVLDPRPTP